MVVVCLCVTYLFFVHFFYINKAVSFLVWIVLHQGLRNPLSRHPGLQQFDLGQPKLVTQNVWRTSNKKVLAFLKLKGENPLNTFLSYPIRFNYVIQDSQNLNWFCTCSLWYDLSYLNAWLEFWPQFHSPLNIENDSASGESVYWGHVLVLYTFVIHYSPFIMFSHFSWFIIFLTIILYSSCLSSWIVIGLLS